ncbi:MAG: hypothetical protein ABR597_03975 [Bacteroidales bacterium]
MTPSLKDLLNVHLQKDSIVSLLRENPAVFDEAIQLVLQSDERTAWRAAWVLFHAMEDHDLRLQPYLPALISALRGKRDGHQRELLKIIERLQINEDQEGELFDICMGIWENPGKSPSSRITAFRIMFAMAKKYPELLQELHFLLQEHYTETLSPGIRHSLRRMLDGTE